MGRTVHLERMMTLAVCGSQPLWSSRLPKRARISSLTWTSREPASTGSAQNSSRTAVSHRCVVLCCVEKASCNDSMLHFHTWDQQMWGPTYILPPEFILQRWHHVDVTSLTSYRLKSSYSGDTTWMSHHLHPTPWIHPTAVTSRGCHITYILPPEFILQLWHHVDVTSLASYHLNSSYSCDTTWMSHHLHPTTWIHPTAVTPRGCHITYILPPEFILQQWHHMDVTSLTSYRPNSSYSSDTTWMSHHLHPTAWIHPTAVKPRGCHITYILCLNSSYSGDTTWMSHHLHPMPEFILQRWHHVDVTSLTSYAWIHPTAVTPHGCHITYILCLNSSYSGDTTWMSHHLHPMPEFILQQWHHVDVTSLTSYRLNSSYSGDTTWMSHHLHPTAWIHPTAVTPRGCHITYILCLNSSYSGDTTWMSHHLHPMPEFILQQWHHMDVTSLTSYAWIHPTAVTPHGCHITYILCLNSSYSGDTTWMSHHLHPMPEFILQQWHHVDVTSLTSYRLNSSYSGDTTWMSHHLHPTAWIHPTAVTPRGCHITYILCLNSSYSGDTTWMSHHLHPMPEFILQRWHHVDVTSLTSYAWIHPTAVTPHGCHITYILCLNSSYSGDTTWMSHHLHPMPEFILQQWHHVDVTSLTSYRLNSSYSGDTTWMSHHLHPTPEFILQRWHHMDVTSLASYRLNSSYSGDTTWMSHHLHPTPEFILQRWHHVDVTSLASYHLNSSYSGDTTWMSHHLHPTTQIHPTAVTPHGCHITCILPPEFILQRWHHVDVTSLTSYRPNSSYSCDTTWMSHHLHPTPEFIL